MALIQKAFSDIITFSRSSNATRVGPTGLVEYAPHNLLPYSEDFTNATWATVGITITANTAVAPNGTVTADLAAGFGGSYIENPVSATARTLTCSIYVQGSGQTIGKTIRLRLVRDSYAEVLTSQEFTLTSSWQRISFTGTFNNTPTTVRFRIDFTPTGGASGDQTLIWGAQLAVGPYPLDYTPTTSAAVYGPRFDFDPVTLAARGLLVEEQRTNIFSYSEQFDNAVWLKRSTTISANATTSPDGTVTADKFVETAVNDQHEIYNAFSATAVPYTLTVYAKAGERNWIYLRLDTDSPVVATWFDLSTGTIGTIGSGVTASITPTGNGWYRCSITRTLTAATFYHVFGMATANGSLAYSGNGTSGLFIWGAQLEAGSFATSYIPTLASTVTRSADVASVNTLSPWFSATEGTLFVESNGQSATSYGRIADLTDSTSTNSIRVYQDTSVSPVRLGFTTSIGASQDFNIIPAVNVGTAVARIAGAYALNSTQAAVNGTLGTEDTACNVATGLDRLMLGRSATGGSLFVGHIRRIAYYPRRLTNAELQALTA